MTVGNGDRKMSEIKERMIRQAMMQYGTICLPSSKSSFSDCFSFENNTLIFWFNTEDNSTHLIAEKIES
jgi:hypothetical protein